MPLRPRTLTRTWIGSGLLLAALPAQAAWAPARLPRADGGPMAYDGARQRVVLFGAGTWEWDGVNWAPRDPATSPTTRHDGALAYDAARERIVLFGGRDSGLNTLGTTWEWDGVDWTLLSPPTSPPARHDHALQYDANRQRVVLFGGTNGIALFGDTWEWDGISWVQGNPAISPTARSGHDVAYDAARQRVVLFGGADASGVVSPADTWEWDGVNWTLQSPSTSPTARRGHALAYDVSRQRLVLFGGWDPSAGPVTDTWEWDGVNWTLRSPATSPTTELGHTLAYDAGTPTRRPVRRLRRHELLRGHLGVGRCELDAAEPGGGAIGTLGARTGLRCRAPARPPVRRP